MASWNDTGVDFKYVAVCRMVIDWCVSNWNVVVSTKINNIGIIIAIIIVIVLTVDRSMVVAGLRDENASMATKIQWYHYKYYHY